MSKVIKIIDHEPTPIERFKGRWALYNVTALCEDGKEVIGSMQGDGDDLWAFESFEQD